MRDFILVVNKYQEFLKSHENQILIKYRSSYCDLKWKEQRIREVEKKPPVRLKQWLNFKMCEFLIMDGLVSGKGITFLPYMNRQELLPTDKQIVLVLVVPPLDTHTPITNWKI